MRKYPRTFAINEKTFEIISQFANQSLTIVDSMETIKTEINIQNISQNF